jgi:hypothetical protein
MEVAFIILVSVTSINCYFGLASALKRRKDDLSLYAKI